MKKFYLIITFICVTIFASAQEVKSGNDNAIPITENSKLVKLYPNPTTSVINFEFIKPVQKDLLLQIFNFTGKKVYESNNVLQKTSIPVTEFLRGVYIFQLKDKSGRIVESGKFQVNK